MCSLVLGAVLMTAACSETPLSPTSASAASSVSGPPTLRWDVVAAGCSPAPSPSPLPDTASARVSLEADGALRATWAIVSDADRAGTLYARFLTYGSDWALCSWDTVDQ
jgi:hypothetical protein